MWKSFANRQKLAKKLNTELTTKPKINLTHVDTQEIVDVFLWCRISLSISSGTQYVTLQKYISHQSLVIYKIETGRANRWGTSNSKPLGPIIMMSQSETLRSSEITFIPLFSAVAQLLLRAFTSHWKRTLELCWAKTIFLSQTGIIWLSSAHAGSHTKHFAGDARSFIYRTGKAKWVQRIWVEGGIIHLPNSSYLRILPY